MKAMVNSMPNKDCEHKDEMQSVDPITKGLRETVIRNSNLSAYGLEQLALACDAVHKKLEDDYDKMRGFCERVKQAAQAREDVTLWGVDYTAMPLDADRVPIHVGDEMQSVIEPASHGTVYRMELTRDGWWIYFGSVGTRPEKSRHHHKPTVEDLLRQFLGECEHASMLGYTDMPQDIFDTYTAKLRLAGDAE